MKFRLTIDIAGTGKLLPINYQYELSAWIYKTIHFGNPQLAEWLHSHGYTNGNKQFKLFTFSNLYPQKYTVNGDRFEIQSGPTTFYISFYAEEAVEPFIIGLFANQEFSIGDKTSKVHFRVNSIEKLPEPVWMPTMTFRAVSPVVVAIRESETSDRTKYLSPEHEQYPAYFTRNLLSKYLAVMKQRSGSSQTISFENQQQMQFRLLGTPKSKVIKIKAGTPSETSVKGYVFDFEITAPIELIKLGYYAGFGEKNSLGFGSCEVR